MRRLIMALAVFGVTAGASPAIRLKSRVIDASAGRPATLGHHYLLQFREEPGAEVRAELARRGIRVLAAAPEAGLMVSSPGEPDLRGLGIVWAGPLEPSDKLSRALFQSRHVAYLVLFHPDVAPAEARVIVRRQGFSILNHPDLLPSHLLVTGPYSRLPDLAAADEVAYIMPASTDLVAGRRVMGCAGAVTENGPVGEYVEVSSGWAKDADGRVDLHYIFQSLTPKIEENAQRNEVARALAEWARYTNLDFSAAETVTDPRTVTILFAHGAHGDAYPFDGPGGMLAHTYYPDPPNREPIAGDMHLDADENWQVGADIDLFSVALHEAGHALGLGHTANPGSVMYPYYQRLTGLSADDIAGIRDLYGDPGATAPVTPSPPASPSQPTPSQPAAPSPAPSPSLPQTDQVPPGLRILSPASTIAATSAASIPVSGTAVDNVGVTAVTWSNSNGGGGPAAGTAAWSAQVPLLVGTNVVIIRAYDAAGNSGWRAITVVRR